MEEKDKNKSSEPTQENTNADFNPTARDFQKTEEDIDSVSESEKEHIDANKRTEQANTTPDKEHVGG